MSKYVNIKYEEHIIYLENSLLDGAVEIDSPYAEELKQIVKSGTTEIKSELEQFLFEHKYLVRETIAESGVQQLLSIMDETLIIGIMPTMKCNFRCVYCYEEHDAPNMSEATFEQIKQFLEQEIVNKNIKYVQVNWFGGEPTLCIEQICKFNSFVLELQEQYHFSFMSGITTNGYLLDVSLLKKLYALGVENYQITLDGWRHDEYRKHSSGIKTLDKIVSNLKEISQLSGEYEFVVRLRYNISEENQDTSWYDYIKEKFGADERFSMYINFVKDWGGEGVKELELCTKQKMDELESAHINYMQKIGLKNSNTMEEKFIPLSNVCYAAYSNSYLFTPDNKILKCSVALNAEENVIGYVDNSQGIILEKDKQRLWSETSIEYCRDCSYILSCLHRACPQQIVVGGQPKELCVLHH